MINGIVRVSSKVKYPNIEPVAVYSLLMSNEHRSIWDLPQKSVQLSLESVKFSSKTAEIFI